MCFVVRVSFRVSSYVCVSSTRVEARAAYVARDDATTVTTSSDDAKSETIRFLTFSPSAIFSVVPARRRRRVVLVHDARERVLSPRYRRGLGPRVPGRPVGRPRAGRRRAKTRISWRATSVENSVSASIRVIRRVGFRRVSRVPRRAHRPPPRRRGHEKRHGSGRARRGEGEGDRA